MVQWNSSLAIGRICRGFQARSYVRRVRGAYFEESISRQQTKRQISIVDGINYGLQLIYQLDHGRDPFRCNLLAGSSSSFRVPSALISAAQYPTRAYREKAGICFEAVDKLAVLTGTTANADFAQLACSSPLDIHAKDYSS